MRKRRIKPRTRTRKILRWFLLILFWTALVLLLLIGATQTGPVQNMLKNYAVRTVNNQLNSELKIGQIDGNLFEILILRDIVITLEDQTVFSLDRIELHWHIFALFGSRIYIDRLIIDKPQVLLARSEDGWNLSRLASPTDRKREDRPDREPSKWKFYLNHFSLSNGNLTLQTNPDNIRVIDDIELETSLAVKPGQTRIEVQHLSLHSDELFLRELATTAILSGNTFEVPSLRLRTDRSRLTAKASGTTSNPTDIRFDLTAEPLAFSEVHPFAGILVPGAAPAVSLEGSWRGDSLQAGITISEEERTLHLNGVFHPATRSYRLHALFERASLHRWLKILPLDLSGSLDVAGSGYRPDSLNAVVQASLSRLRVGDIAARGVSLSGAMDRRSVQIDLDSDGHWGRLTLATEGVIPPDPSWDARLRLYRFDPSVIPGVRLPGRISGLIRTSGSGNTLEELAAQASIDLEPSTAGPVSLDSLHLRCGTQDGVLSLDTLAVSLPGGDLEATAKGTHKGIDSSALHFKAEALDSLAHALQIPPMEGRLDLFLSAAGPYSRLAGELRIQGDSLVWQNYTTEQLALDGNYALTGSIPYWNGQIDISGASLSGTPIKRLHNQLTFDAGLFSGNLSIDSSRRAGLFLEFQGELEPERLLVEMPSLEVRIDSVLWANDPGDTLRIHRDGTDISLEGLRLRESGQRLRLDALYRQPDRINARLNLTDVDIDKLDPHLPEPLPVSGRTSLDMYLDGSFEDPEIRLFLSLEDGQLFEYPFKKIEHNLHMTADSLDASLHLITMLEEPLSIEAASPILWPPDEEHGLFDFSRPASLQVHFDSLQISQFNPLLDNKYIMQGVASCDLESRLQNQQLQAGGFFRLHGATLEVPQLNLAYQDIDLYLSLEKNRLLINQLDALSGESTLMGSGEVVFDPNLLAGPKSLDVSLKAGNFPFGNVEGFRLRTDIDLNVSGPLEDLHTEGLVRVIQSTIDLDRFRKDRGFEGGEPMLVSARQRQRGNVKVHSDTTGSRNWLPEKVSTRLRVDITRGTWLRSSDMQVEIMGEVIVNQNERGLYLEGSITAVRGKYDFYGKSFEIRQGTLTFTGGATIDPLIDLTAEYIFRDIDRERRTLTVHVTGRVSANEIAFTLDDEPLEMTDAMSYILFGRSSQELTHGEKSQVQQTSAQSMAAGLIAGKLAAGITSKIQEQLRLDVIEFSGGEGWEQASLVVGKYLTRNLFVSYERQINLSDTKEPEEELFQMEYEINRYFMLRGTKGNERSTGCDLIWRWEGD